MVKNDPIKADKFIKFYTAIKTELEEAQKTTNDEKLKNSISKDIEELNKKIDHFLRKKLGWLFLRKVDDNHGYIQYR